MRSSRRPTVLVIGALLVVVTVLAAVGTALLVRAEGDEPSGDAAAVTSSSTTSSVPSTTTIVVVHESLPAGVSEVATVVPALDDVAVRATPPPGWDDTLTPVVTSSDQEPPRS